ncbi:MAG: hypothetical protein UU16_C0006G0028 [Candidatus Woesebacteria bacterium GW2011_GWA2_40_7]|uniref:Uncharacterized protein n=3 Tax=Candidatus Woeseibacteriota TaxID=1752722 RepID=A0A0G0X7C9_9BACT|nr:MAG: hypothetical protein UT17_C0002G0089 [Candidatus Woesebacteria bacterium GW2011_GWB1_39_10]KKR74074.1 MAG: hypothetical protein UU16_C0006G0028 [Candidatus Woesebacteria bacterium GW2011_GWA2_40_7]KKR92560.1 MAG: hypothetical protein UU42_C0001G0164 [Candidatus Woesebacteria bacterium GW2011_GWA1_41_13b]
MKKTLFQKTASFIATIAVLINSFGAPLTVIAQEITPSPTPAETSSPTPEATASTELTASPTAQSDATPAETASPTPEITPTPTDTVTPAPTDTPIATQAPESNPTVQGPPASDQPTSSPTATPIVTPAQPEVEGSLTTEIVETNLFSETLQENSWFNLVTDKLDYAPTEAAVITGTGFAAGKTYNLTVSSVDEPATTTTVEVIADLNGSFAYVYQLDGNYRPNYSVEVKSDGVIVASTTFTDSPVSGTLLDSDGANDEPGQKDLTKLFFDYTNIPTSINIGWDWDDSGFSGANTGDACALFDTDTDGYANYALCVTVDNDPATFQTTSLYSCNDTRSDRCPSEAPISLFTSTCGANVQATDPFPGPPAAQQGDDYPNDSVASCTAQLSEVGGASSKLLDVCSFPSSISHSDPSDCIVASTASQTGFLEVKKVLDPTSDTGKFDLQIDGTTYAFDATHNGTTGEKIVDADSHTVSETAGTGTTLSNYTSSVVCRDTNGTGSVVSTTGSAPSWTVGVGNGDDIVCTITNTLRQAHLIVVKHVINDNGGTAVAGNFTLDSGGTNDTPDNFAGVESPGTDVTLDAGSYNVTESGPGGYSANYSADCSGSISAGQTKTCTVTNDDQAATLHVIKVVTNDNGGTKTFTDFSFQVNGGGATAFEADGQNDLTVNAGTYSVTEPGVAGYSTTYDNCSNLVISNGGSATCTITNDDIQPKLTLTKIVTNDNGGNAVVNDFPLFVGATGVTSGVQNGFDVGSYTASETNLTGYTAGSWGGDCATDGSITLAAGDVKACSITNNDQAAHIVLIKNVTNDNGGSAGANDFGLTVGSSSVTSSSTTDVNSNVSTTLNETGLAGYDFVSITGDAKCPAVLGGTVTLNEGETVTCTITNDDIAPTLKLTKSVTNDNGGTAVAGSWTLGADGDSGFQDLGDSTTFHTVKAGVSYALSESGLAGYAQDGNWSCDGGDQNGSNIALGLAQDIICTVTNNDIAPSLTLIKALVTNNGGNDTESDWTLTASGPTGFSGVGSSISNGASFYTGTYDLSESGPGGYIASNWVCTGGTQNDGNTITLSLGQSATCTITNDDVPASITLTKVVQNNFGGTAGVDDFGLSIGGTSVSSGQTLSVNSNSSYTLNEAGLSGYSFVSLTGDDLCPDVLGGTVTLDEGGTISCIITNSDVQPQLTVIKHVINDNGGSSLAGAFTINVTGTSVSTTSFGGSESGTTVTLNAGSYTVDEDLFAGYSKTLGADCFGTIAVGEHKTCTITNNDIAPTLTYVKSVTNNYGGTLGATDFPLFINGSQVITGTPNTLLANYLYTLTETQQTGYTGGYFTGDCSADGSIVLSVGDNKTCYISNTDVQPKLTITKVVINDDGGTKEITDFPLFVNSTSVKSGVQNGFNADSYTVSETGISGYTSTISGDCTANGSVTLAVGDVKSCVITNDDIAPRLTLVKTVVNDNGGDKVVSDFILKINDTSVISGEENILSAGTYTASEIELPGYAATVWGGDCNRDGSITLNPGDNKSCTITNDDQPATLRVVKVIDPGNTGATESFGDFWFEVNGGGTSAFEADGQNDLTVDAGTYNVTEKGVTGYSTSYDNCSDVAIPNGGEATCTVTNTAIAPTLTVIKIVENGNTGATFSSSDFQMKVDDANVPQNSAQDETIGSHTVSELGPSGYTSVFSGDCNTDGNVTLALADDKTCTITNTAIDPTLTLIKTVVNDNGGQKEVSDFPLFIDDNGVTSGESRVQTVGTHTATETSDAGYTASVWGGDCAENGTITLSLGDDKICTITNDDNPGTLIVKKVIDGGEASFQDFSFQINGGEPVGFDSEDGQNEETVDAGTYSVTEPKVENYVTSYDNCTRIQIANGESATCTITNIWQNPQISIIKENNAGGGVGAGSTVIYTIKVSNNGNVNFDNVLVTDFLPGGFTYVVGSTTGATFINVLGSKLTWNIDNLAPEETATITYQVTTNSALTDGDYKNFATCQATYNEEETISCDQVNSTVKIGHGISYGGNLQGQVLGASTELPATGSPTLLLILSLGLLGTGLYLKGYDKKRNVKN